MCASAVAIRMSRSGNTAADLGRWASHRATYKCCGSLEVASPAAPPCAPLQRCSLRQRKGALVLRQRKGAVVWGTAEARAPHALHPCPPAHFASFSPPPPPSPLLLPLPLPLLARLSDQGGGIPQADLERVWQFGFTTSPAAGGAGAGGRGAPPPPPARPHTASQEAGSSIRGGAAGGGGGGGGGGGTGAVMGSSGSGSFPPDATGGAAAGQASLGEGLGLDNASPGASFGAGFGAAWAAMESAGGSGVGRFRIAGACTARGAAVETRGVAGRAMWAQGPERVATTFPPSYCRRPGVWPAPRPPCNLHAPARPTAWLLTTVPPSESLLQA